MPSDDDDSLPELPAPVFRSGGTSGVALPLRTRNNNSSTTGGTTACMINNNDDSTRNDDDDFPQEGSAPPAQPDESQPTKTDSQVRYEEVHGSKRTLYAMCLGLTAHPTEGEAGGGPPRKLGDFTIEPFSSSKNKKIFKPAQDHLAKEVNRRFRLFSIALADRFKTDNQSAKFLADWLNKNPLRDANDIEYLRREEKKFYDSVLAAHLEKQAIAEAATCRRAAGSRSSSRSTTTTATAGGANGSTTVANTTTGATGGAGGTRGVGGLLFSEIATMRLVHCLCEDAQVKDAFMNRNMTMDRQELDARNSAMRPPSWEQQAADRFNDTSFKPVSYVWPELHNAFADPIELSLDECPSTLTPTQIASWFSDRKAKLVLIVSRWEESGSGDGQPNDDRMLLQQTQQQTQPSNQQQPAQPPGPRPGFRRVYVEELGPDYFEDVPDEEQMRFKGCKKSDFLNGNKPSLLYFWKMCEDHHILTTAMDVLHESVGRSSSR